MDRDLDLLVYGATGFTGRVVAERAVARAGDLRVGIGGRDRGKLEALARELGDVEVVIADAQDDDALNALAAKTRVVLSAAGPFSLYGSRLFAACVAQRTAYTDINGEPPWVREMIDAHHDKAIADGTALVPFAGYDSVPSDVCALLIARQMRELHDQPVRWIHGTFRSRGKWAGGTAATLMNGFRADAHTRRVRRDPFSLVPNARVADDERRRLRDPVELFRSPTGELEAPHVMGVINTRVVRRSAALFAERGAPYGQHFRYSEGMARGRTLRAKMRTNAFLLGLGAVSFALKRPRLRWLGERMLPSKGEGPTTEEMDSGRTRATFTGEGDRGARVEVRLDFAGDPGNRFTALAVVEAGLALAAGEAAGGGVLTPAVAFGDRLLERLREAGVSIEVR